MKNNLKAPRWRKQLSAPVDLLPGSLRSGPTAAPVLRIFFHLIGAGILLLSLSCHPKIQPVGDRTTITLNDQLQLEAELIDTDPFTTDLSRWKPELEPGGTIALTDGKLEITAAGGCTLWFKEKLKQPLMIEYTATVIDEGGPHDRVSDLNCFWLADDPESGELLADTSRTGKFSQYDRLRLYYVGLGGHNNTKTRFRRYRGTGEKPLLPEHDLSDPKYLITPNAPNHIRIVVFEGEVQYWRNDQLIYDFYDPSPYVSGYFGFRTVRNHMTVEDFKIYKINQLQP
ncbi:DUF6250 domain-containing protein [Flavilitoribacter nigricans]|uniref:Tat pathway signal sequence domain protein n=1 Tax=Flavilitoribacter nigricans (strain ATCC 23147 / DSM 23189 / NBRC 102662 / NCIMB 1420 / SS-2) TaxID=1122177 RepID=A0A2D0N2I3_FLAN2|nr:DUF6250 domain-containing protein [Flavilitoribacter nigricans]PHN02705.1 Tat pathway signal sequence domain protein [Flavilitoribacter nigricans DSM 23189 = NBRC 102662]